MSLSKGRTYSKNLHIEEMDVFLKDVGMLGP